MCFIALRFVSRAICTTQTEAAAEAESEEEESEEEESEEEESEEESPEGTELGRLPSAELSEFEGAAEEESAEEPENLIMGETPAMFWSTTVAMVFGGILLGLLVRYFYKQWKANKEEEASKAAKEGRETGENGNGKIEACNPLHASKSGFITNAEGGNSTDTSSLSGTETQAEEKAAFA